MEVLFVEIKTRHQSPKAFQQFFSHETGLHKVDISVDIKTPKINRINRYQQFVPALSGNHVLSSQEEVEAVFCCVGGGGLLAGVGAFLKAVKPEIKAPSCPFRWNSNYDF